VRRSKMFGRVLQEWSGNGSFIEGKSGEEGGVPKKRGLCLEGGEGVGPFGKKKAWRIGMVQK